MHFELSVSALLRQSGSQDQLKTVTVTARKFGVRPLVMFMDSVVMFMDSELAVVVRLRRLRHRPDSQ